MHILRTVLDDGFVTMIMLKMVVKQEITIESLHVEIVISLLDDFKYLSQEFDDNVLGLVKLKAFYPYEYMSNIDKFKEQ